MAEKKQTIIEEALLDMKKIENALKANSKEILRSIMKEEIEGYMKDSVKEDETEYEEEEIGVDDDEVATDDVSPVEDETSEDAVAELPVGGEEEIDLDDEEPLDLDMTTASDDDVIAVYKKLTGEDEIEVVSNKEVKITDPASGNQYVVKLGGEGDKKVTTPISTVDTDDDTELEVGDDSEMELDNDELELEDDDLEESIVYEIELQDDEDEDKIEEKIQIGKGKTVANNKTSIVGAGGKANNVALESVTIKYNTLLAETAQLKKENTEFKESLTKFRDMLTETVVFNSNLAHVVKLFSEHTTSKDEKKQIISRFDDNVSSIKESKKLYKTIVSELTNKKTVTESVDNKLNKTTSSSKTQITESTAYVDVESNRIKDLIKRVEQR